MPKSMPSKAQARKRHNKTQFTFKRVDLPQPLGPRSIHSWPEGTENEQSLRIDTNLRCFLVIEQFRLLHSIATPLSMPSTLHIPKKTEIYNQSQKKKIKIAPKEHTRCLINCLAETKIVLKIFFQIEPRRMDGVGRREKMRCNCKGANEPHHL